jgi:ABC-2 type transport system permease protein
MTMIATQNDVATGVRAAPSRRPQGWLHQAWRFAVVETATYLRDSTAIFWTFLYPIVLLLIMMLVFGGGTSGTFSMAVDVEGRGLAATQFVEKLETNFAALDGLDIDLRRVTADQRSPDGRVRLIIPDSFGNADAVQPVRVRLSTTPDASSGSMLSIVAQSAAELSNDIANAPNQVQLAYEIGANDASAMTTSVYYVVGLAVLTIVSTALFGFSGPLIDLRSRGGLKLFQFMPVYRSAFLTGFALCRIVILAVFVSLFIAGGLALFGGFGSVSGEGWAVLLALTLAGTISFLAAGLAIAGLVTNNALGAAMINIINLPIIFLSDLFIPLSSMPDAVADVSRLTPVYLLVDAMRGVAAGTHSLADCGPVFLALSCLRHLRRWSCRHSNGG